MHGYENFPEDVKIAFEDFLDKGLLQTKDGWKQLPYHVILESKSTFLNFTVENLSVSLLLVDKKSYKFINIDNFLFLINTNLKEQRSVHFESIYNKRYRMNEMSISEKAVILRKHICLGDLYTYSRLMETDLYKWIFEANQSWVDMAEGNGIVLRYAKLSGINA